MISIDLTGDVAAMAKPRQLIAAIGNGTFDKVIERAAANTLKDHLRALEASRPNKQGWPRTHFWASAARSVSSARQPGHIQVSVNQVGFRQRLQGGVIKPGRGISRKSGKPTMFLAIPIHARSYGHRPAEFTNLKFSVDPKVGRVLVEHRERREKEKLPKAKTPAERAARRAAGPSFRVISEATPLFILRRKVNQKPDPSIVPTDAVIETSIRSAISDTVRSLLARGQSPGGTP